MFAHKCRESYRAQLFASPPAPNRITRGLPIVNLWVLRHGYAITSPDGVLMAVGLERLDASLIAITRCSFFSPIAKWPVRSLPQSTGCGRSAAALSQVPCKGRADGFLPATRAIPDRICVAHTLKFEM